MSVVIIVKVSEGIVLAADSAATLMGEINGPEGPQKGVLKTFYNAKKLLQIGNFPIGVLTWGAASIGHRTLESLVREWEHNNNWESVKQYGKSFQIKECAAGLLEHLQKVHQQEFENIPKEQRPGVGMAVAGYSKGEFFPEIWRFVVPFDNEIQNQRPDKDDKPDFGASWFGATESIVRLHFGRDENAIKIISEKFNISEKEIFESLSPLQYPVPFAQMPLQDAIDYANYIINVAIGRYRFVIGPELCGGEIEIAAIKQNEFNWISRKSWEV